MNKRTCGGCTACCFALEVRNNNGTLRSPARQLCADCSGLGCSVYANRPLVCEKWECDWLKGFGEENQRPDNLGVIFTTSDTWFGRTPTLVEYRPGALQSNEVKAVIREHIGSCKLVLLCDVLGGRTYAVGKDWLLQKEQCEPGALFVEMET